MVALPLRDDALPTADEVAAADAAAEEARAKARANRGAKAPAPEPEKPTKTAKADKSAAEDAVPDLSDLPE
jgi:hypothetical protein